MASTPSPLVSIITRTKDRHVLLKRALRSVLDQRFTDWEHIIVNDGGDAAALDAFIEPYAEEYQGRLKVIHNPESLGMQQASNRGLASASGTYVGIHDDDDAWRPEFLEACVAFLGGQPEGSPYKGVITHTVRVWEEVDKKGRIVELSRDDYMPLDHVNLFRACFENPFPPIAFLYHRCVHDEIGRFNPTFDVAGDLDFNVRFLSRYEIGVIPRKLALYHWRRKSRDEKLENSVIAEKALHGRKLNEWLNHYLRSSVTTGANSLGALINTAHITVAALCRAEEALANLGELKQRSEKQTWLLNDSRAAEEDLAKRAADLKAHLTTVSQQLSNSIEPLLHGTGENIAALEGMSAARLSDLKEHLGAISKDLQGIHSGLLVDLKEHLSAISTDLQGIDSGRLVDLKEHLSAISRDLQGIDSGRLIDLKEHLSAISTDLQLIDSGRLVDLKEHLSAISTDLQEMNNQRFSDLKEHLTSISTDLMAVNQEVAQLKENMRGFSIGPLRIYWKRRAQRKEMRS